jgi:hypothetical protein
MNSILETEKNKLQDKLTQKLLNTFDEVIDDRQKHYIKN